MRIAIGMKRSMIAKLRDELTTALDATPEDRTVEVEVYGDTDPAGIVLTVSNDDMERAEVPDDVIYAEVDE